MNSQLSIREDRTNSAKLTGFTTALLALVVYGAPACGGGNDGYTLDNVCDKFPPQWCEQLVPCCGTWYDRDTCIEQKRNECLSHVEHTRAQNLNFNADRVDACLRGEQDLFLECDVTLVGFKHELHDMRDCFDIFTGHRPPGARCAFDEECLMPANGFAVCSNREHVCVQWVLALNGQPCMSTDPNLIVHCDEGFYCDPSPTAMGAPPQCRPVLPLGLPCDPQLSGQCGESAYCDLGGLSCAPRKLTGQPCVPPPPGVTQPEGGECFSDRCDPSTATCANREGPDMQRVVDERVCRGVGTPLEIRIEDL